MELARNFAFYQGQYEETSDLNAFSGSLQAGDFIGMDFDNDGDMDHIGFVTLIGTYNTYNGTYYRDFVIAQHTGDYIQWVSHTDNGWDTFNGSATYARLRRSS